MKTAYFVVTDLHLDYKKANRVNYFAEVLDAMTQILDVASRYRENGYRVVQLLLGDVFDGSMSNSSEAMQAIEVFHYFCDQFDDTYSVVGNHELNFPSDNPFWFLTSEITDNSLNSLKRFIQPRGLNSTIKVVDKLVDGDTTIYFNHFGTPAKVPGVNGVNIGLFHQNVGSNDICKMWGTFDNVEEASYIQPYNYCFFGHMHLAFGKYYLNEKKSCSGIWLGSIGRTKVDEIDDNNLERNIPAIIVEDGLFREVKDNNIVLLDSEASIDVERLKASEKSKKIIAEVRKNSDSAYVGKTLFQAVSETVKDTDLEFLLDFLDSPWEELYDGYRSTLENPLEEDEDSDGD